MYLDRLMVRGNMNAHLFKHELFRRYSVVLFPTKEENKVRSQIPDTYPVPFKFPAIKKLRYGLGLGVFNYDILNCHHLLYSIL
jgi:hypothetical protein